MKRTPGGELIVPEIVEREALRDEGLFCYFIDNEYKQPSAVVRWRGVNPRLILLVDRRTRSVEDG